MIFAFRNDGKRKGESERERVSGEEGEGGEGRGAKGDGGGLRTNEPGS